MGASAAAQQTVFNVPSADVLKRGEVYAEIDLTARPLDGVMSFTPRMVVGMGKDVEVGVNLGSFSTGDGNVANVAPTIKWRAYQWRRSGISVLVGDDVVIPTRRTTFTLGNYAYIQASKTFERTRVTGGLYHFTAGVVANGPLVGFQGSLEQGVTPKLTLAADWYSRRSSVGYLTMGAILKVSPRLTLYPAYQLGNTGIGRGNHQFLFELGWNIR